MKKELAELFLISLIVLSLVSAFTIPTAKAFGGGIVESLGNNNSVASTCAVTLSAQGGVVKNDYIIISVWIAKGTTVSSVSDGTGGSNFVKTISSTVNVDDEQWIEQYTGNTGSVTITATFSGSAANKCIATEVDGLSSKTADITSTGSGTLTSTTPWTASVSSFSPPNTDFCYASVAATETGTVTAISQAPASPFQNDKTIGTAGNGKQLFDYAAWNFDATAFAPTTATDTITTTGLTGGGWDDIIGCYPTATTFTSSTSTTTTTTSTSITTTTTSTTTTTTSITTTTTTTSTTSITTTTTTTTTTTSSTSLSTSTTASTVTTTSTETGAVVNFIDAPIFPINYAMIILWFALLYIPKNLYIKIIDCIFGVVIGINTLVGVFWLISNGTIVQIQSNFDLGLGLIVLSMSIIYIFLIGTELMKKPKQPIAGL